MATKLANSWIPFRAFFNRAEMYGIDLAAAATTLLAELANKEGDHSARGLKRIFDDVSPSPAEFRASMDHQEEWCRLGDQFDALSSALATDPIELQRHDDRVQIESDLARVKWKLDHLRPIVKPFSGWRERLPRETQSLVVPKRFWSEFAEIDADCTSTWIDDPDDPMLSGEINWISGIASEMIFGENLNRQEIRFELLEMDPELVRSSFSRLQVGAPSVIRSIDDKRRENFIRNHCGAGGTDGAHREWRESPEFDGTTQPEFRTEWKAIRGKRGPGAPRKSNP